MAEEVSNNASVDENLSHLKPSSDISQSPVTSELPAPLRHEFESQFGRDFSGVRIHEGHEATLMGAQAYTSGNNIFFAPNQYQPHTESGKQLISKELQVMGHEALHTVQQRAGVQL
jgi:hypothetical protein